MSNNVVTLAAASKTVAVPLVILSLTLWDISPQGHARDEIKPVEWSS